LITGGGKEQLGLKQSHFGPRCAPVLASAALAAFVFATFEEAHELELRDSLPR
jgi:hypothetical protein